MSQVFEELLRNHQDELDTVAAIYSDDFEINQPNSFHIRVQYSSLDIMVVFSLKKYPQSRPDVSLKHKDKNAVMTSKQRQSLLECINDTVKETIFESDEYLFDFVQAVMDSIDEYFGSFHKKHDEESKSDQMINNQKDISTYILQYDHMRNKEKYVCIIKKWCHQLKIVGRLIIFNHIIVHIIQGRKDSLQCFMQRSKTKKVDIDSKGRKCKEKMLKTLYQCDGNQIQQLFEEWTVETVSNKTDFIKCGGSNKEIECILGNVCN